ncbi:exosortase A [Azonexus sp.]|jgi:exosortase A|uniref:exosortase A n=1 Tax=Azonexus sp. TaxID=1872668 RepID=UPI0028375DE4|nr:exosortase A [Azonexus sp.]MDR1996224.1 exosortase A [Azonexus sp.]
MNAVVPPLSPSWRQALLLLPLLIAWLIYWYWDTAAAMVGIWYRSETYAHAFLVPPITLWLIWRQRAAVLAEQPRTSLLLAVPVAGTTLAWLFGELTAVNALTQFALVATLVLAIMALLGPPVSKRLAFPLAFLFFSVPFGDFMMPKLMEWTATFTVLALRATGIPVYQEGLQFVIPSGHWSVVEACSGIRYIIASVTIGTLFAYLNYTSLRRRLLFIGVSLVVPVIANWLRAYMIVMLGHFSGNRIATGVDHLIYGWVFFGVVILIMFLIGARWSEPEAAPAPPAELATGQPAGTTGRAWLAAGIVALIAAAGPLAFIAIDRADRAGPVTLAALPPPAGWQEGADLPSWKPNFSGASGELQTSFQRDGQNVGLYIAYYRNQDYRNKLVTSTNTLAASTNKHWAIVARTTVVPETAGLPARVVAADLLETGSSPEVRLRAWQWYWIDGRLTASDAGAKLLTALSRLSGRGDDAAVVILYAPATTAASALPAFAAAAAPEINRLLAATRDQR